MNFRKGDAVYITYAYRTVEGWVLIASGNGVSLMLGFDGVLGHPEGGLFVGMLPVMRKGDRYDFEDIVEHREVVVTPRPCPSTRSTRVLEEAEAWKVLDGLCLDCGAKLNEGPHGGLSVNWICPGCGSAFNVLGPRGILGVERISAPKVRPS